MPVFSLEIDIITNKVNSKIVEANTTYILFPFLNKQAEKLKYKRENVTQD